jgi:hypothetical protein
MPRWYRGRAVSATKLADNSWGPSPYDFEIDTEVVRRAVEQLLD